MEKDTEDILSATGDLVTRIQPILCSSDGMDSSANQSNLVAELVNTFKIEDEDEDGDESDVVVRRWYTEVCAWATLKFVDANIPEISFPVKRDDRLTLLVCYAAFMSAELVMEELNFDMSYRYCGAQRTIKCIQEAVLACFDMMCRNLFIEKCWDVITLRNSIIKAANFATYYISSQSDQLHFQADPMYDDFILFTFQGCITGSGEHEVLFSEMQPSTKSMDDDLVGFSGDLKKIKERMIRSQPKLDIIPIVGMGGIGKTTLARKVYKDLEKTKIFHVRAWVVVSQQFCERDVLLSILEAVAPLPNEVYKEDTETLAEILCRRLRGWRYFIVLDDIWTTKAWDQMKLCFPDDNNGSRIILTCRNTEVASHVDRENPPHLMNFLGIQDSWKLLHRKVYGKDACPRELINIGMQIAEKCQGLPLAIDVMAGHLSNIGKTQESWEDVAKRVGFQTDATQMESLSNILSISYNGLPDHLKACFLTLVNFPKNFEISVRKLFRLWISMGFLPQKLSNSAEELTLEEVAMKCFENLIGKSLITVKKKKFDGTAKVCSIHDLLWDLSMREFRNEGHLIFCSKSNNMNGSDDDRKYVMGICKTLLYFDQSFASDYPVNYEGFEELRVLDILKQSFDHFPVEITGLINLRYFALATSGNIPDLIYKLSNLETLLNYHERAGQILPKEIWLLSCLRHLNVGTCTYLSEPPSDGFEGSCGPLLPNLQSLSHLNSSSCTKEVFSNIQNLKQLGIDESEEDYIEDELLSCALENIVNLYQLEALKLCCSSKLERPRRIPDWGSFLPNTIKKLSLSRTNLPWSEMNALATLPNLEVIKLKENAFKGQEWEMDDEDQFLKLKYLLLESMDLIFWKASSENFPNLQWLRIRGCYGLCRIPIEFGDMYTLELIDMEFCNPTLYDSAIEIQSEQSNVGNDKLVLKFGRVHPMFQMFAFIVVFVWMAMKLNNFKPKSGHRKKRGSTS